jgi:hypothetical protein
MALNEIEKALIKSLNYSNNLNVRLNWKVFFSTRKIKSDIQLKEREERIYEFLITEFEYNNLQTIFTVKKFNQLFLDWNNEKFSEKLSVIPTRSEIEKVLKYYFVNNRDNSKCFYYAMNSDDVEFIIKASRNLGIYEIKQVETSEESTSEELNDVQKIAILINNIVSLSTNMTEKEKIEIVKQLEKALNVKATTNIIKKENIA